MERSFVLQYGKINFPASVGGRPPSVVAFGEVISWGEENPITSVAKMAARNMGAIFWKQFTGFDDLGQPGKHGDT